MADGMNPKFTGQMRDTESGLDFFNARYYSPSQGSFVSPDPDNAGFEIGDPQTWNGYSYVTNNPLAFIDPTGLQQGVSSSNPPNGEPSSPSWIFWFSYGPPSYPGTFWGPNPLFFYGPPALPKRNLSATQSSQAKPTRTFGACMESHASDFSLAGILDNGFAATGHTDIQPGRSFVGSVVGGNNITGPFFAVFGRGDQSSRNGLTNAANQGLLSDFGILGAIGENLTHGRRTTSIMSLNLTGTPGRGAQALNRAPALRKTLGRLGKFGFATTIMDAGLTLGEVIDCAVGVLP